MKKKTSKRKEIDSERRTGLKKKIIDGRKRLGRGEKKKVPVVKGQKLKEKITVNVKEEN